MQLATIGKRTLCVGMGFSVLFGLSSCASFGGNVSGSFHCRAGEGICAPTTTIDDQALAMISGESVDGYQTPAGPFEPSGASSNRNVVAGGSREIRIVFPAYVDRQGRTYEKTAVRAYVRAAEFDGASLARGVNPKAASHLSMSGPGLDEIAGQAPERKNLVADAKTAKNEQSNKPQSTAIDDIKTQVASKLAQNKSNVSAGSFPAGVD